MLAFCCSDRTGTGSLHQRIVTHMCVEPNSSSGTGLADMEGILRGIGLVTRDVHSRGEPSLSQARPECGIGEAA